MTPREKGDIGFDVGEGNRAAISIDIEEGNRPGHPGAVARSEKETGTYLQSAALAFRMVSAESQAAGV
jgi:hypothetical protein